jgi:hypothetical protein
MAKPAELVNMKGRIGVKLYLCATCAAKLRKLKAEGHPMRAIDLGGLCEACRASLKEYF